MHGMCSYLEEESKDGTIVIWKDGMRMERMEEGEDRKGERVEIDRLI